MTTALYESEIEQLPLDLLRDENGYEILYRPDTSYETSAERTLIDVILSTHLRNAIDHLNPHISANTRQEAYHIVLLTPPSPCRKTTKHSTACSLRGWMQKSASVVEN